MSLRGIDIRESGAILFRSLIQDIGGGIVPSGNSQLRLYEFQTDGRLFQYDFAANKLTFTSGILTTPSGLMTQRKTESVTDAIGGKDTGIWTYLLPHSSGFKEGYIYLARVTNPSGTPVDQYREFQWGNGVLATVIKAEQPGISIIASGVAEQVPTFEQIDNLLINQTNDYLVPIRSAIVATEGYYIINDPSPTTTSFGTNMTHADRFWEDALFVVGPGSLLEGQSKPILSYVQANGRITLSEPLSSAPASGDQFVIKADHIHPVSQIASGVWSANPTDYNTGFGAQLQSVYFADIKQYYDLANNRDEYSIQWFSGPTAVTSGQLTSPALSVYNTSTGAAILQNKVLTYTSPVLGSVRYNSSAAEVLASGEPYLAVVSGTISGSNRSFYKVIGRHNI